MAEKFPLVMNGLVTCVELNVLPLGSYYVFIGMDWLEAHKVKIDYYNNTFECIDEEWNARVVGGRAKVISMRKISIMQLKKSFRKGFQLYAGHIVEATNNETPRLEYYHVLQEFKDVFPDEVPGLPPKRDIDFTIELVPGAALVSKVASRMSTPEMLELNMQLQ